MRIMAIFTAALLLASCSITRLDADALGGKWKISEVRGRGLSQESDLDFDVKAGRLGIYAGCNRLSTDYTAGQGGIRFGYTVSTLMACSEEMRSAEGGISQVLTQASAFRIRNQTLSLEDDAGNVLLRAGRKEGEIPGNARQDSRQTEGRVFRLH